MNEIVSLLRSQSLRRQGLLLTHVEAFTIQESEKLVSLHLILEIWLLKSVVASTPLVMMRLNSPVAWHMLVLDNLALRGWMLFLLSYRLGLLVLCQRSMLGIILVLHRIGEWTSCRCNLRSPRQIYFILVHLLLLTLSMSERWGQIMRGRWTCDWDCMVISRHWRSRSKQVKHVVVSYRMTGFPLVQCHIVHSLLFNLMLMGLLISFLDVSCTLWHVVLTAFW